jgi:Family of unknown function (DUF5689)
MKNKINQLFTVLFTVVLFSSCVNDAFKEPTEECVDPTLVKNKEVQAVYAAAVAVPTSPVATDDVLEAVVTSSDEGGNFFKSVSLMSLDGTRGFSMSIDEYNLYTKNLQPGRKVYVKIKDLYTSLPTGGARGLNIGGIPSGTFNTLSRISALD